MEVIYDTQRILDRVKADIAKEEIENISARLDDAREREKELTVHSDTKGIFVLPMAQDLPSVFVRRGQLLGYVMDRSAINARVVVSQADVDSVRRKTRKVTVRLPEDLDTVLTAELKREVPAATDQLPGLALSREGGGEIAIDPRDTFGKKAYQKMFLFDVELPPSSRGIYHVGSRVYVRFDHGAEPVAFRWYRGLRQLFLRRFNV
jgi:putative peptide zinc metalloprotease protein